MIDGFDVILKELNESLGMIDDAAVNQLIKAIVSSRRVIVVGVGRVMIALKAWVKRMKHLGIDINYLGSETEGQVGPGDLVLVASSSGETVIPKIIAEKAHGLNAHVFYIGCTLGSSVDRSAEARLLLPGKTKYAFPGEFDSRQPMSTLFEQQLFLLGDCIALKIMQMKQLAEDDVKKEHANLE